VIRTAALAMVLILASAALAEDVIELETGRVVKGKITREEKAWVGLETGDGVVWFERKEIKSIAREGEPAPQPEPRPNPEPAEDSDNDVPEKDAETGRRPGPAPTGRTDPAPAVGSRRAPGPPRAEATDEGLSTEGEHIRQGLASEELALRVKAAEWIVETWPKWRSAIEHALTKEPSETVRVEAVRILDHEAVGDIDQLVLTALDDKSAKVRVATLRVVRHRMITGAETRAVEIMRSDPTWMVRQEAIRTLEDVGGSMCLPHVMSAWSGELDKDRRRRYRRVMAALLGEDFGEDTAGWYRAADELFMGTREIRKGKVEDPNDAR